MIFPDAFANKFRFIYVLFLFFSSLLFWGIYGAHLSWETTTRLNVLLIIVIALVHIFYRWRTGPFMNWLAPDLLYVMFYVLFHLGYLFLWSLNIVPVVEMIIAKPDYYPKTMLIVSIGLTSFLFGYELLARQTVPRDVQELPSILWPVFGMALMALALVIHLTYIYLAGIGNFLAHGYHVASFMRLYVSNTLLWTWQTYFFMMGFGIYIIAVALIHRRLFAGKLGISLFLGYLILIALEGDRGPFVTIGLILLLVRHYLIKPIRFKVLAVFVVCALFVFTFIGIVRNVTSFDVSKMTEEYRYVSQTGQVQWFTPFVEMGGSVRTTNQTVALLDGEEYPRMHGITYVLSVLRIVPFLQGFYSRHFGGTTPSAWLTYVLFGGSENAAGTGFSIPTEGYLNFGMPGVIIQMMIIGVLMRKIYEKFMRSHSPVASFVFFVSLGLFMVSVRGETNLFFATIVHVIILAFLLKLVLGTHYAESEEEHEGGNHMQLSYE